MFRQLRPALVSLLLLTVITGIVYPAIVTLLGNALFAEEARGSFIESGGVIVGSRLIAQPFTGPAYFWPRPSACDYNAAASSGSNLGPTNPALTKAVRDRIASLRSAGAGAGVVPVDLVTASGSGLDPDISVAAAEYQAPRIAAARHLPLTAVRALIQRHIQGRTLGIFGEPRVNVLLLNLALDGRAVSPVRQEGPPSTSLPWRARGFLPEME